MRAGSALTQLVEFFDGFPDGDITWLLVNGLGVTVATATVTPVVDSASAVITVTGVQNAIEADVLSSPRELQWSYTVGGVIHSGRRRYRLEVFLPLGVSEEGVRRKLGVEDHELGDDDIDLVTAYGKFQETVGEDNLTAVITAGGHPALLASHAIEALAALTVLPTLLVSLAAKQSSGTDQFQRATIDWDAIRAQLENTLAEGYVVVDPTLDVTANFGPLLVAVVRDDPVTGGTV